MAIYRKQTACRVCSASDLVEILVFGASPLADRLLTKSQLAELDVAVPLTLMFCPGCSLVQIAETVDPEVLFGGDHPYFSSVSGTLLRHSRSNAEELIARLRLGPESLVIEIASNDGYMLKSFVERGVPVARHRSGGDAGRRRHRGWGADAPGLLRARACRTTEGRGTRRRSDHRQQCARPRGGPEWLGG